MGIGRPGQLLDRGGSECAARRPHHAAHPRGRRRIPRTAPVAADRQEYSDHIALPIVLADGNKEEDRQHPRRLCGRGRVPRSPKSIQGIFSPCHHGFDDPWLTAACACRGRARIYAAVVRAEPESRSIFSIRAQSRASNFTSDASSLPMKGRKLLPSYLRVVRGIVDSEDLPLIYQPRDAASRTRWCPHPPQLTRRY